MMSAEGAGMAKSAGGLVKQSMQFTPEQWAWLQQRAAQTGSVSIAPVVRMLIQEAMIADREQSAEGERVA
jgi:hypothetical protein